MDKGSEIHLLHVHPALCNVIRGASQVPQAFTVVYGLRTQSAEEEAVATGHSTTLHSRHLAGKKGYACAVDVAALTKGEVDWAKGREAVVYGQINKQIQISARALNVIVEWGGDWKDFKDWGHFQLPWSQYP